jgi:hypothetical protein
LSRTSDLSNQFLFTADLGEAPNWRLQNGLALTVTMTRLLSLKMSHEVKRVNRPVPGFRADGCNPLRCAGGQLLEGHNPGDSSALRVIMNRS